PYNKDGFENEITDNLDKILIVSKNPSNKNNEHAIVMYYSFELAEERKRRNKYMKESENESDEEKSKEEESEEENNGNIKLIEKGNKEEIIEDESVEVELIEDNEELVEDESDKVEEESDEVYRRFKSDITLTDNKLKAAKLYKEFLLLEKGLLVIALFFDDNAQQFDSSVINGALSMDLYQEKQEPAVLILAEFDNSNLRDQINLL
ncbi:11375_t:CDS:2, partial [Ambispora leptoticha]